MPTNAKYASQVTTQKYGQHTSIDGVEIIQLPLQGDDGGNFSEIARVTAGKVEQSKAPFEVRQISMSILTPHAIKAYHLHQKQVDIWYAIPSDRLIVNLHDVRDGSPTFDQHMRLVMGGGKNFSLYIPEGVAHGVANMYQRDMVLFYMTNQQFNPQDPDEQRLPWDAFGAEVWEVVKG